MRRRWAACALLLGALVAPNGVFAQPVVTMGCDLDPTLLGAVRYRNLSNQGMGATEIYIGQSPLITRTEGHVTWSGGKAVEFVYDGSTLTTKVGSTPSQVTVSKNVGNLGALNYLEINLTKNTSATSINLNNVQLNGVSLDSFSKATGTMGNTCWRVTGINVGGGFTLTGTLALTGSFGGGDSSLAQIDVGLVTPADDEGPVTSNVTVTPDPVLLNGDATVNASVDDSETGNNTIDSAEYSVDGGAWLPMNSADGLFDEVQENVEVTFTATAVGTHQVCVRGTDAEGNVGDPTCQSFLVTYKFTGFFSPVENDFLNMAKAGQAIPIKWRLTDANDVPIDDPASFADLFSSQNLCEGGLPTDSVAEDAAGDSGLQYNGDGYWQFNWKTEKAYANTCRAMYVEFNSGATSPIVKFQFKK
jgi:hypothetical protein